MTLRRRAIALILLAAFASFVLSVVLWFGDEKSSGLFVGLWVPSILALGSFVLLALDSERRDR